MKRVQHRENLVPPSQALRTIAPRQLDGGLVRFGAAITKKNPIRKGSATEVSGKLRLRGNMVEIGYVYEVLRLTLDRADHCGMIVSQAIDGDASGKIQILFSVRIPDLDPFSPHQCDGIAGIGLRHVSVSQLYDVLVLHPLLEDDLRPDSRLGKDFQQYGMLDPPIDDVGFPHSALQGIDAAFHLWDHPSCHHSFVNHLTGLINL